MNRCVHGQPALSNALTCTLCEWDAQLRADLRVAQDRQRTAEGIIDTLRREADVLRATLAQREAEAAVMRSALEIARRMTVLSSTGPVEWRSEVMQSLIKAIDVALAPDAGKPLHAELVALREVYKAAANISAHCWNLVEMRVALMTACEQYRKVSP